MEFKNYGNLSNPHSYTVCIPFVFEWEMLFKTI